MVTSPNLQLEAFEREIYRRIVIERVPAGEVAQQLQLHVGEVRQIVARVTEALVAAAPVESKEQRQQRIQVSEQIAAARLAELYAEVMRAYRRSQGEQKIVRQVGSEAPVTIRRHSDGDARLLAAASRIALLASKLPAGNLLEGAGPRSEAAGTQPRGEAGATADEGKTKNHPVRACSKTAGEQPVTSTPLPITGDVKSTDEFLSELFSRSGAQPKDAQSRPVQTSVAAKPKPR